VSKILIISGPTATGKTSLAIKLAKKYNGQIISADSRQIYRGLDIGTGKDHPKNQTIHLIDIINPNQAFSSAEYRQLALEQINQIHSQGKLPIIVGGTGLYIDSLINPRHTFSIKPNFILRFILNHLSTPTLQSILKFLDSKTYNSLNHSDSLNPHRLIRKIEISLSLKNLKSEKTKLDNYLHISLTAPNDYLFPRIDQRIDQRLQAGLLSEIKSLLTQYNWSHPGLNTLAYKEFKPYFDKVSFVKGRSDEAERDFVLKSCIQRWRFDEHAYARRQKTWFKKIPGINFIDISKSDFNQQIDKLVANFLSS